MSRVCVVGGGWSGLAAAVHATCLGDDVTLIEMAPQLGGRARCVTIDGIEFDNGQHILIGAYRQTLQLMRTVGVNVDGAFERRPLALVYGDGTGLALGHGAPVVAFVRGVLNARGWSLTERWQLLRSAASWAAARFRCDAAMTVADITAGLAPRLRNDLINPLCVAAMNTPAECASAQVFLRVLKDALFSGPGSADVLLPRCSMSALLPEPAGRWLVERAARVELGRRVTKLEPERNGWRVDDERFDKVVLACTAKEAARLCRSVAPSWSQLAEAFDYEAIITVYVHSDGSAIPQPMTALRAGLDAPAQFVFRHVRPGYFAAVSSGAGEWVAQGAEATAAAVQRQLSAELPASWCTYPTVVRTLIERRATFACVPGLQRPPASIAPGLIAAGDYVDGPYPATLEGAVLSGRAAVTCRNAGRGFALQKPRHTIPA